MAITATLVTALAGGKINYVPITPNSTEFTVELPTGKWLVQVEACNNESGSRNVTLGGVVSRVGGYNSCPITRIVQGGTLTGTGNQDCTFTHGIAIRLGD